jgi:hypothetical protein
MLVNSNQRAACKFLAAMDEDGRIPSSSLCMRMLVGIRPRINANRTRNILSLTHSHSLDPRPSPCARLFSHLLLRPVTMLVTWTGAGYPAGRFHLHTPASTFLAGQIRLQKQAGDISLVSKGPPKLRWLGAREPSTYTRSGKGSTKPSPNCSSSSGSDPRSTTPHHPGPLVYFKVYAARYGVRTGPLPGRGMVVERLGPRVRPSN